MNANKIILFSFLGMLFFSCTKEKSLNKFMVDSWQTTYLKIEMPTYQKSDSLEIYEDKFDNNPKLIAQSKYNSNGTFSAWFVNNRGEQISKSNGTWNVVGDSLFVAFFYNERNMKVSYKITKTKEGFIGKSKYDWDEDGDFDDLLTMKTKRIHLD